MVRAADRMANAKIIGLRPTLSDSIPQNGIEMQQISWATALIQYAVEESIPRSVMAKAVM